MDRMTKTMAREKLVLKMHWILAVLISLEQIALCVFANLTNGNCNYENDISESFHCRKLLQRLQTFLSGQIQEWPKQKFKCRYY